MEHSVTITLPEQRFPHDPDILALSPKQKLDVAEPPSYSVSDRSQLTPKEHFVAVRTGAKEGLEAPGRRHTLAQMTGAGGGSLSGSLPAYPPGVAVDAQIKI